MRWRGNTKNLDNQGSIGATAKVEDRHGSPSVIRSDVMTFISIVVVVGCLRDEGHAPAFKPLLNPYCTYIQADRFQNLISVAPSFASTISHPRCRRSRIRAVTVTMAYKGSR